MQFFIYNIKQFFVVKVHFLKAHARCRCRKLAALNMPGKNPDSSGSNPSAGIHASGLQCG